MGIQIPFLTALLISLETGITLTTCLETAASFACIGIEVEDGMSTTRASRMRTKAVFMFVEARDCEDWKTVLDYLLFYTACLRISHCVSLQSIEDLGLGMQARRFILLYPNCEYWFRFRGLKRKRIIHCCSEYLTRLMDSTAKHSTARSCFQQYCISNLIPESFNAIAAEIQILYL